MRLPSLPWNERENRRTAGKLMPASLFLLQMPSDTSERLADRKTEPDCQANGKRTN